MQNTYSSSKSNSLKTLGGKLTGIFSSVYSNQNHDSILAQVNVSLVLFEHYLIETESGNYCELKSIDSASIADAASALSNTQEESANILLLLPGSDFIATTYNMAVGNEKMLKSALQLQSHNLIPAYEEDLLLALNTSSNDGIALWHSAVKADSLFHAFKDKGLLLSAIAPRALLASEAEQDITIVDEDSSNCVQVHILDGSIKSFLSISCLDFNNDLFISQWQIETARINSAIRKEFTQLDHWLELKQKVSALSAYCFFPKGAEQVAMAAATKKKTKLMAGISIAAMLLISLPFISNWITINSLESDLVEQQELASNARALRGSILAMEDEWGPIVDYPRLDVVGILLSLNEIEVIQNGLNSMSINKSVIDIAGIADDPAYLIELLAEHREFYNITQSRSISGGRNPASGNRFGLRMNLTEVDFEGYEEKYPVQED